MAVIIRWALVSLVFIVVAGCGSLDSPGGDATDAAAPPTAVAAAVNEVASAAIEGNSTTVSELAAEGFEFDFDRPDFSFSDHLSEDDNVALLERLALLATFEPARRQSPFGNGTVQELWIYPGFALDPPSTWSDSLITDAHDSDLFDTSELVRYQSEGAYTGFSFGFSPSGDWVFCTEGRVAATPR